MNLGLNEPRNRRQKVTRNVTTPLCSALPIELDGRNAGQLDGLMGWIEAADLKNPQVDDCSTIWAGGPWSFQPSTCRCGRD